MSKKNLILMSLDDSKINKIANVVSNDTSKKILDLLAEKDMTESELSEKLNIAISTVHYNLQQLMDAGLVTVEEYHYSKKGREVNHYKLANKYIIIAPKGTKKTGLKQKLKNILPVGILALAGAGIIELTQRLMPMSEPVEQAAFANRAAPMAAKVAADDTVMLAAESAPQTMPVEAIAQTTPLWQNIALWFLIGAIFTILIFFILSLFKKNE